ncbi:MAG: hypothetical protein ABIQ88_13875 [Chitinophagaceae bacterium]
MSDVTMSDVSMANVDYDDAGWAWHSYVKAWIVFAARPRCGKKSPLFALSSICIPLIALLRQAITGGRVKSIEECVDAFAPGYTAQVYDAPTAPSTPLGRLPNNYELNIR